MGVMSEPRVEYERLRILTFWWMLELFSPQSVPALTRKATRPSDRQAMQWNPGEPLPWDKLAPPEPIGETPPISRPPVLLLGYQPSTTDAPRGRVFRAA